MVLAILKKNNKYDSFGFIDLKALMMLNPQDKGSMSIVISAVFSKSLFVIKIS